MDNFLSMQKHKANKIVLHKPISSLSEARSLLQKPGEAVLIVRGKPRNLALRCPCGCGDFLIINLDPQAGKAWRAYNRKRGLSLYPSIWRETGCESHFIISQNDIWWCDWEEDYNASDFDSQLQQTILPHLCTEKFVPFEEIAAEIDEVPWLVLVACRELVRRGLAREGEGKERGSFSAK